MNKQMFTGCFLSTRIHKYKCPNCHIGILRLFGDFNSQQTEWSKKAGGEDWFETEHIELRYSCTLKCADCSELVFSVGRGIVREFYEDDDNELEGWRKDYVEFYTPKYFYPPLSIIDCPPNTPANVAESLLTASSLYFSSPAACCNNIRIAAEEILDSLDVPSAQGDGKGRLSFGRRIELLPPERQGVAVLFDALRWLGNHGSHPGDSIGNNDALNAFELVELLLEEVYSDRRRKIRDLAIAIKSAKGPVREAQSLAETLGLETMDKTQSPQKQSMSSE